MSVYRGLAPVDGFKLYRINTERTQVRRDWLVAKTSGFSNGYSASERAEKTADP